MRGVGLELWDRSSPALCSIQVQNPGATGGLTTVAVDGTTITGNGTSGSPLKVVPITAFFAAPIASFYTQAATANTLTVTAWMIENPVTFAHIGVSIATADAAHNSDIGLYNAAGTLVANIGAQAIAGTGNTTFATVQGAQTIPQGVYWLAFTSAASTFALTLLHNGAGFGSSGSTGTSAGGALPSSFTPPALGIGGFAPYYGIY